MLLICMMIIAAVSVFDIYITFKLQSLIYDNELNPIGRWLIELDNGSVALFMTAKAVGLSLILWVIPLMYLFWKKSWALTIAISLTLVQLFVFYFLIS